MFRLTSTVRVIALCGRNIYFPRNDIKFKNGDIYKFNWYNQKVMYGTTGITFKKNDFRQFSKNDRKYYDGSIDNRKYYDRSIDNSLKKENYDQDKPNKIKWYESKDFFNIVMRTLKILLTIVIIFMFIDTKQPLFLLALIFTI